MLVTNPQTIMTTDTGTPAPFYQLPDMPPPERPPGPASGAEFDDWYWKWQQFNWQIAAVRAEAERACAANTARAIELQQQMNAAPSPLPTRAALIWQAMLAHPQVTGMTELNVADYCEKLADAFIKRNPGAAA